MLLSPPPLKNLKRKIASICSEESVAAKKVSTSAPTADDEGRFAISRAPLTRGILIPDSVLEEEHRDDHRRRFQLKKRSMNSRRYPAQGKVLLADLQLDLDLVRNEAFDEDTEVQQLGSAFSKVSHHLPNSRKLG